MCPSAHNPIIPAQVAVAPIEAPWSNDRACVRRHLAEVTALSALIDTLASEQHLLQNVLDSIVYPVLTLPPEITTNIFVQCIPGDPAPSPYTAPLLIAQICRQWRAIAFATPTLWQSITLDYGYRPICHCGTLLEMWLHNSANLPLFLSFGCEVQMPLLIDTCLIHCHRWREITISSGVKLAAPHTHFPILRNVTLRRHIGGDVPTFLVQLPWARLTTLTVETFGHASECFPMLTDCSGLLHLTHTAVADRHNLSIFQYPHVTLDSLQSLNIGARSSGLMAHLTLPRLRQLTLNGKFGKARSPVQALLSRSSCPLQRLSIIFDEGQDSTPESLQFFLPAVPTVTHLALTIPVSPQLRHAISPLASTDILPLMENLSIDVVRVRDHYDSLLDVLRGHGRRSGGANLKAFSLLLRPDAHPDSPSASSPLSENVMTQFRHLVAGGLQIHIRVQGDSWSSALL
ncbi:hypothetical protein DFH09DRAFT_1462705 [Mycena vulgaris]|nr:hypothetical protein DFH09DRAFT_1462705 [Mycena vulgaris]